MSKSSCRPDVVKLLPLICMATMLCAFRTRPCHAITFDPVWTDALADQTRALALGDYDGDNDLDLFVVNSGFSRMYRYDGGDVLTLVWSTPVSQTSYSGDLGDFDNDGDMDILVGNLGFFNVIYRNDAGAFSFAWTSSLPEDTLSVAWVDYDNDGDLDVSAGNRDEPNSIYRNNGDGTFTRVWETPDSMFTRAIAWGDYDRDGDPDLLVGNYNQPNQIFRNDGNGVFTLAWSSPDTENTISIRWGDYDGDGDLDIIVGNYSHKNRIYRNDGGMFNSAWQADEAGFYTNSVDLGDCDADGDMDLLSSNFRQKNHVHVNGAGVLALAWESNEEEDSSAAAWWDYDRDGDLDAVTGNDAQGNRVYRNNANPSNTVPSAPTPIARADTQPGLVSLSWSAASDDTTPAALMGYRIQIGTQTGVYRIVSTPYDGYPGNAGASTTFHINLSTGTYYWRVAALDTTGLQSAWSVEDSFIVEDIAPAIYDNQDGDEIWRNADPGAAFDVDATDTGGSLLHSLQYTVHTEMGLGGNQVLSWTTIADAIGAPSYVSNWGLNFAALPEGVNYVSVRAEDRAGNMSGTATDVFHVNKDMSAPGNPAAVSAWVDAAQSAALADATWSSTPVPVFIWTAAPDYPADGGAGVQDYSLYFGQLPAGSPEITSAATTWTSTATLVSGATYYFRIRTRDNAGNATNAQTFFTYRYDADPPETPTVSAWDSSLMAAALTSYSVNDAPAPHFTWAEANDLPLIPANSGVAGYLIYFGTNSSGIPDTFTTDTAWTATATLQSSSTYYFRLSVEDAAGNRSAIATAFVYGYSTADTEPPGVTDNQPDDITWRNANTGSYDVDFTDTGGALLYRIQARACSTNANCDDLAAWTDVVSSLSQASYTANWALPQTLWESLPDGGAYISVRAEDGEGNTSQTGPVFSVSKDTSAPASAASAPTIAQATDFSVTITDLDTGGAGLTACEYLVESLQESWGTTQDWTARICNTAFTISVGTEGACRMQGDDACRISVRSVDSASNVSDTSTALVSINWDIPDTEPPDVSLTAPAPGQNVSRILPVMGSVQAGDINWWRLEYGAGTTPVQWVPITSGSAGFSHGEVADWDTSALAGTYTVRLLAADLSGNQTCASATISISNTMRLTGAVPGYQWTLLGMSADPGNVSPIELFGSGLYKVYHWDPAAVDEPNIGKYRFPDEIEPATAIWLKSFQGNLPYDYSSSLVPNSEEFSVHIKQGWNLFAIPYTEAMSTSRMQIRYGNMSLSLDQASAQGLISGVVIRYDGTSWVQVRSEEPFEPWQGYGLYAYADVELIFNPPGLAASPAARRVRRIVDFELSIAARTPSGADADNRLRAMSGAGPGCDALDLPEPPAPPESNAVSLRFLPSEGACLFRALSMDTRPALPHGGSHNWTFSVLPAYPGETVTLTWDNTALPADRFTFTLLDLATGAQIDMAAQGFYSYTAAAGGASEARFRIQVVKLAAESVTRSVTLQPGWNLVSVPLEPEVTDALTQLGDNLPLLNMYQYFDGQFYGNKTADIQAGFGFWIYVADSAVIDFTGIPLAADQSVTVPLKPGWNLIGNPFADELAWGGNITADCGAGAIPLNQAAASGILSEKIFLYDGSAYLPQDLGSTLLPWKGYFVKATQACDLILAR